MVKGEDWRRNGKGRGLKAIFGFQQNFLAESRFANRVISKSQRLPFLKCENLLIQKCNSTNRIHISFEHQTEICPYLLRFCNWWIGTMINGAEQQQQQQIFEF